MAHLKKMFTNRHLIGSLYLPPLLITLPVFLIIFVSTNSMSKQQGIQFVLKPSDQTQQRTLHLDENNKQEEFIRRKGNVHLETRAFLPEDNLSTKEKLPRSSLKGQVVGISFFPGEDFPISVDHHSKPQSGIFSVRGHVRGMGFSSFSLTVASENYIMTLRYPEKAVLYRVHGNTKTGEGYVIEIDLKNLPPRKNLPSRVPPK